MDLEKDAESIQLNNYANVECRYYQSKTSCVFVNKVNPFNTVGNYHGRVLKDNSKRSSGEIIDIYDNSTKAVNDKTANSNNIPQEFNTDIFLHHPYLQEVIGATHERSEKTISQPTFYSSSKILDASYATSCSRDVPKTLSHGEVECEDYIPSNRYEAFTRNEIYNKPVEINENRQPDKNTYCRPVHNMYNEDFVFKTMQRHARLQKIVKKLVTERQKEKQREAWNNYINDLKNKHRYYSNEPTRICPQYVPNEDNQSELIDDYWDARNSWHQSDPCRSLLYNLYGSYRDLHLDENHRISHSGSRQYYERDAYCYPTASQGRLIMLNRERERNNLIARSANKRDAKVIEKNSSKRNCDVSNVKKPCKSLSSSVNVQTEQKQMNSRGVITEGKHEENHPANRTSFRDLFKKRASRVTRMKEQTIQTNETSVSPLEHIEAKLDVLIKSVNSAIVEMRGTRNIKPMNRLITKSRSTSCTFKDLSDLGLNKSKSETYGFKKLDEVLFTTVIQNKAKSDKVTEIATSTPTFKEANIGKIERIIQEEMEKSEKIKKDIEELLQTKCSRQCSVQIEFDIPTREISTVVSKPRPCAEHEIQVQDISSLVRSEDNMGTRYMTIAVNTDPLGLLALLRVSTETIKQLISYMPNLNYNAYLSLLQLPRRPCIAHFMCNICGATFDRPSQLSEHIQNHSLGSRRSCSVCQHMSYSESDHIGPFDCKYCGQKFTRAYSRDLHQHACAKSFGRKHDVQLNLMFLR